MQVFDTNYNYVTFYNVLFLYPRYLEDRASKYIENQRPLCQRQSISYNCLSELFDKRCEPLMVASVLILRNISVVVAFSAHANSAAILTVMSAALMWAGSTAHHFQYARST